MMARMRTWFLLLASVALGASMARAADYKVSGAGSSEVNGTYVFEGYNEGKPYYRFGDYRLGYCRNSWVIARGDWWFFGLYSYYTTFSNSDTPPSTGWWPDMRGMSPAPTVEPAGPSLSYSSAAFQEDALNEGAFNDTITITCSGVSFTGPNDYTFETYKYTTANVPAGLEVYITKISDQELRVHLYSNGQAEHLSVNSVANMELTFLNAAFSTGDAAGVSGATKSDLAVVCRSGDEMPVITSASSDLDDYYSARVANLAGGGFVVIWLKTGGYLFAQRYSAANAKVGDAFQVTLSPYVGDPAVAGLSSGGFVVVWRDNSENICGQCYDAGGRMVGDAFMANVNAVGNGKPAVSGIAADGGLAVVWHSNGSDGSGYGICGALFDQGGHVTVGQFTVNTHTENNQMTPSVAKLADGGFAVTWQSDGQDGSGDGVYGQRLDNCGNAVGGEFRVNTQTTGHQRNSSVAALADGGFVVTWAYADPFNNQGNFIYGQRFGADGAPAGAEFQVNSDTSYNKDMPSVAGLADGGFAVAWTSYGQDGSGAGVYGQRYAAAGTPAGGEFRVNATTAGDQTGPVVAGLADGSYVVAWTYSDNSSGIYVGSSAPLFARGFTDFTEMGLVKRVRFAVDAGSAATDIGSALRAYDPYDHHDLTWSVVTPPAHGTLSGFPATQTGSDSILAPAGATYRPEAGFFGADPFDIAVTDGATTNQVTVLMDVYEFRYSFSGEYGVHGTLFPSGWVYVLAGGSTSFVAVADAYWHIDALRTNGVAVAAASGKGAYTNEFVEARGNVDVSVTFAPNVTSNNTPEWWLAQYGWTGDFETAALSDTDGDGVAAWQEYVARTSPTDAKSRLSLKGAAPVRTGASAAFKGLRLSWSSATGVVYRIEYAPSLSGGTFQTLPGASGLSATPPLNVYTDLQYEAQARFYRIKVVE